MSRIAVPAVAFLICLILTPLVRALARRRGWLAAPTADRWHRKPTALFGGIAIFAGFAIPLFLFSRFTKDLLASPSTLGDLTDASAGAALLVGAGLIFAVGLVDDFVHIKPHSKLLGQILTASLMAFFGFRLEWVESLTGDTLLTILWIVGITNALNLLDNMDGLCAGVGGIASLVLAVLLWNVFPAASLFALALAGACAAFLVYNFRPASIFMGDCGSLVIGFSLAFLSVCFSRHGSAPQSFSGVVVPVLALMVPIFDTTLVTIIRTLSGRKASTGGRDHTSHRLVLVGMTETRAVLFLYGITVVSGFTAVVVSRSDAFTSPAVIVPMGISLVLLFAYLAQIRVYPEKEFSALRGRTFTPVLMELTYKRQILMVLLDLFLISFSYYLSYRLRFSGRDFAAYFPVFLRSLPAVIACKYAAFFAMGMYRGIWGFLSVNDLGVYFKASVLGTLLSVVVVTFVYRFQDFSKGIFIIDWFLITGFLVATRGSFRLFVDAMKKSALSGHRVILYGAGRGGEILLREILNNPSLAVKPVGFVDDDPLKAGKRLQGFPILGTSGDLERLAEDMKVAGVIVTFITPEKGVMKDLLGLCSSRGLFLKRFAVCMTDVDLP